MCATYPFTSCDWRRVWSTWAHCRPRDALWYLCCVLLSNSAYCSTCACASRVSVSPGTFSLALLSSFAAGLWVPRLLSKPLHALCSFQSVFAVCLTRCLLASAIVLSGSFLDRFAARLCWIVPPFHRILLQCFATYYPCPIWPLSDSSGCCFFIDAIFFVPSIQT